MFDIKLEFSETENPFENFISDFELIKVMYSDKISILTENFTEKQIKFLLNLSYDFEVEQNIIDIVLNFKFDSLVVEDNKLAVPYQIEFSIIHESGVNFLSVKIFVFWLRKKITAYQEFYKSYIVTIEKNDSAILYNIIENLKNWLEPPEIHIMLNWLQTQHEEKIILISNEFEICQNLNKNQNKETKELEELNKNKVK